MNYLRFGALLGIAILLVAACDLAGKEDFYPMTVGSTWDFAGYTTLDTDDPDTLWANVTRTEVTGTDQLSSGEDVQVFRNVDTMFTFYPPAPGTTVTTTTNYVREKDNLVLVYDSKDDVAPDTALVLPLEDGRSWNIGVRGDSVIAASVVGREDVTVAAGEFKDCWKLAYDVSVDTISYTMYVWYADGVGRVFQRLDQSLGEYQVAVRHELTAYDVK